MSYVKFLQLCFTQKQTSSRSIQEGRLEFFIPGVNSGAYNQPTLHVHARIREWKASFWNLLPRQSSLSMTLSDDQFDQLFLEMQKIKKLRDGLRELKKENETNEH
jgi:hypothetical protein